MVEFVVCTVFKKSNTYNVDTVHKIYNGLYKFNPDVSFMCLSDDDTVPNYTPLIHNFPTWWSKIELFRKDLFNSNQRVFYIDLDTLIFCNIKDIIPLSGPYFFKDFNLNTPSSCLMSWTGNELSFIYDDFVNCKDPMNKRHKINHRQVIYGDQSWIELCLKKHKTNFKYFQDIPSLSEEIISWPRNKYTEPSKKKLVCFYGKEKPWNCTGWAREYYDSI